MEINLLHNYKGRLTNELRLTKGIQIVEDWLGQYLIDNGHALFVSQNVGTPYNIGIDNAVDGAELTVAFALTDEQETPIVSDSPELEELELRQRYEELSGRAPHPAMKLETLRAKVAELEA